MPSGTPPERPSDDSAERYRHSESPNEDLSTTIVLSVADVLDRDVETLQKLSDIVDIDALDALFVSEDPNIRLEFEYSDCLVTVKRGTTILITPPEARS